MSFSELMATYGSLYGQAFINTWTLTIVSFIGVMILGLLITVMRVCPLRPLRIVGDFYVQLFRNIPGISLLIIIVYALPHLGLVLDYRTCVIVAVILIASAFGSENLMSGINTIGVGQIEASRSLGLTFTQMLRLIVIPQALRSAVLPMTNLLIAVMLTTAIGSQVPMNPPELTGIVSYINTRTVGGILPFIVSAFMYAGSAFVIGFIGNRVDRKVRILR